MDEKLRDQLYELYHEVKVMNLPENLYDFYQKVIQLENASDKFELERDTLQVILREVEGENEDLLKKVAALEKQLEREA